MPTRRRPGSTHTASRTTAARRRPRSRRWKVAPEVVKSLVGIALAILGAAILIGLTLHGQGALTDWMVNFVAPYFGALRWALPFILLLLAYYLERAKGEGWDWQLTLVGTVVAYAGALGFVGIVASGRAGHFGRWLAINLEPLVTAPGAAIVFAGMGLAGALLALDMSLPAVVTPALRIARRAFDVLSRPAPKGDGEHASDRAQLAAAGAGANGRPNGRRGRTENSVGAEADAARRGGERSVAIPVAIPNPGPMSATFAPAAGALALRDAPPLRDGGSIRDGQPPRDGRDARDGRDGRGPGEGAGTAEDGSPANGTLAAGTGLRVGLDEGVEPEPPRPEYHLPPLVLLEDVTPRKTDTAMDHQRNAAIVEAKLASFNIAAHVVAWNAGPVVTQYEIEPSPEIKVSRIEALSDDLAMALAARTIRIEAPIPGKSVVGLEIPNKDFNIVALRRILEEVDLRGASKLTFALGRDVAGHARATDLAKMPHLLIAGATGSGKSVMVNALITSLLCNATPDEVRFILVDLKRVELNAYNGLPHLMVPVITEPERAKAALKWAVAEMETRYRRFAGATARNITGFNETRADPTDKLPYLVIVIDELADLMMREGKNIEDPIVRLAQKARATGIHLVLATQRPSVNVVTGLIKANFPSRIAFAMASQIDSRTILDMPGAEDLIGRGDMLFQPADLPRPIRLQGVFVSDKEIANVTEHWRAEAEPHYDLGILESDDEGSATANEIADEDADRLLMDAVGVVQEYDRASASLLQRRLKIGYARAARIIDQLEARGYIGAFDGSNARQVLRRDVGAPGPVTAHEDDE